MADLTASSSTSGFFQALPTLPPQYSDASAESNHRGATSAPDDATLGRILDLYLPSDATEVRQHLHHIARLALDPRVLVHSTDAEINRPVLRPLTTFGEENRNDPLWTTTGWKKLKDIGTQEGVVAVAYNHRNTRVNRRVYQFALGHLYGPTSTMTSCPMSMTDGAATLLLRHAEDPDHDQPGRSKVFAEAYRRLTSRDPEHAWTSGQWMTERTGGSDVSGTETVANRLSKKELAHESEAGRGEDAVGMPLGPWRIDGFKWFSSATDSEMTVLLARTSKGGLSAFYVPMRRRLGRKSATAGIINQQDPARTELNGIRIQRLKDKLGTKSLPTAELELKGARGWLIGNEGQGVKEISAILNITRLHTGAGSTSGWSRGLAICRAYSKVRKVRGGLLQDNPAHLRWMSEETVRYRAAAHFAFLGVALQGAAEQGWEQATAGTKATALIPRGNDELAALLRLLLPVTKAQVSVASVHGLRQCMECLGGVGYCENNEDGGLMNIAKVYRDNLVNPIWEGTVSVMAEDVVRVLLDKRLGDGKVVEKVFVPWIHSILGKVLNAYSIEVAIIEDRLQTFLRLTQSIAKEELLYRGRELLDLIEVAVCGSLLLFDATVNPDVVADAVAKRWLQARCLNTQQQTQSKEDWAKSVIIDRQIFLGLEHGRAARESRL